MNHRPDLFALKVIKMFEERLPQGMSAKSIPLGIAAKYNFNLTNHIGDIIGQRIDFTDLREIKKAFTTVAEIDEHTIRLFQDPVMKELLLVRNLIAHRGGFIDETFKKQANHSGKVGEQIDVPAETIMKYMAVVTLAGGGLMKAVDEALQA